MDAPANFEELRGTSRIPRYGLEGLRCKALTSVLPGAWANRSEVTLGTIE
jgi:hypothetical protein